MAGHMLPLSSILFYVHHSAFLPSIALALLYFTVLSFSGQMITFLLNSWYTSVHVGIARTVSTAFELSATWIAPRLMTRIGAVRGGI
jgi:iron-regulated transporter 1